MYIYYSIHNSGAFVRMSWTKFAHSTYFGKARYARPQKDLDTDFRRARRESDRHAAHRRTVHATPFGIRRLYRAYCRAYVARRYLTYLFELARSFRASVSVYRHAYITYYGEMYANFRAAFGGFRAYRVAPRLSQGAKCRVPLVCCRHTAAAATPAQSSALITRKIIVYCT